VVESERKTPLERPRYRRDGNINMDLRATAREGKDWIDLTEGRSKWWVLVHAVARFRAP
jgi:hypothetical protein